MQKIPSFTIDHTRLLRGVYVSRIDRLPGGGTVTTLDVRMTEPNRQAPLDPKALHTIEHLAATWLRNDPEWKDRVVYWGPMGCCTGNYLLLSGEVKPDDIMPALRNMFAFIADFEGDIPGASARDCGNWTFNDLESARREARRFKEEVLDCITPANTQYPA